MRLGGLLVLVLTGVLFTMLGPDAHATFTADSGQVVATAVHPLDAATTRADTRVPLLEMYTATWCPPCAPADRAVDRLLEERSPGLARNATNGTVGLAVLSYHPWPDLGGEDPYGIPEGDHRLRSKHGAFWYPSVYVDGWLVAAAETRSQSVDAGMEEEAYNRYGALLRDAAAIDVPFVIETTTGGGTTAGVVVHVRAEATDDVAGPLFAQGVVWEDHVRFRGSNGVEDHRMTVRALLPRHELSDQARGDVAEWSWTVAIPVDADPDQVGVTVLIEAAWGRSAPQGPGPVVALGAATAGATGLALAWMRRQKRGRDRPGGEAT